MTTVYTLTDRKRALDSAQMELRGAIAALNVAIVDYGQVSQERYEVQRRLSAVLGGLVSLAVDYGRALERDLIACDTRAEVG